MLTGTSKVLTSVNMSYTPNLKCLQNLRCDIIYNM